LPTRTNFPGSAGVDAVEATHPIAEGKQQEMTIGLPKELPEVLVDTDMIRRVLINC